MIEIAEWRVELRPRAELALRALETAEATLLDNVRGVTIEEALDAAGGHRSALGILKHTAAWAHVYRSFAFDAAPRHWRELDWPSGLRDLIEPSTEYVDEMIAWFETAMRSWREAVRNLDDALFDTPRPCHWGGTAPLFDIVLMVANHAAYHAGEFNQIVSIARGEAWEYSEEVEENHLSTAGHRVRPNWMSEDQAKAYEAYMALRDSELHPQ